MSRPPLFVPLLALLGCAADKAAGDSDDTSAADDTSPAVDDPDDTGGVDDTAEDTGGSADTGEPAVVVGCEHVESGVVPEDATWMVLDGESDTLFRFASDPFSTAYPAYSGTKNLNEEFVAGGNGFKLERPGCVVAVSTRWELEAGGGSAATVWVWPDFSSDGYVFDVDNPYTSADVEISDDDEGAWITSALDAPIRIDQPLHVFAGYNRDPETLGPQLLMEDTYNTDEPYYAGARFVGMDTRYFYGGAAFVWYTWQVRLAVVYDAEIAEADKPFRVSDVLSGSSRVAWGDYDGDGDDDLMTNGPTLYRNDGGTFTDVTSEALSDAGAYAGGGVWGDYDNDGCLDFFGQGTSYSAGEVLLHNTCDGAFEDVTLASGVNDLQSERDCDGDGAEEHSPTEGAAWFDVDGDGYLDLYLANYECSSEYDYYVNYNDKLWRNNGDGTFTDWSDTAGVELTNQAGRGVTTADYDQDGDTDLFVSNYRLDPNFFYENQGDGTIVDVAEAAGVQGTYRPRYGAYGHTIGSAFGDIDNDGDFDLVSANLAHPFYYHFSDKTQVLVNDGSGVFVDEAEARGVYYRETHSNPTLFDADNDGDLDLFITSVYSSRDSDFYRNDGEGNFTLDNYASGALIQGGWGAAVSDFDGDGDVDLLAYDLFENAEGADGHWLEVTLVGGVGWMDGGRSNRSAIGGVLSAQVGATTQLRHVSGGSGTSVQDSLTQHFGLGSESVVDRLEVLFPGGAVVTVDAIEADQRIWVCEDGTVGTDGPPCD